MDQIDVAAIRHWARTKIVLAYVFLAVLVPNIALSFLVAATPTPLLQILDGALALAQALTFIVSGNFILRWIYLTNRTAHLLAPGAVAIGPGWNIGWFFVPVASLWKPFQGLRECYQASLNPDAPYHVELPPAMRPWWGCWIGYGILTDLAFRFAGQGAGIPADILYGLAGLLGVALCLTLISVIREMEAAQTGLAQGLVFA